MRLVAVHVHLARERMRADIGLYFRRAAASSRGETSSAMPAGQAFAEELFKSAAAAAKAHLPTPTKKMCRPARRIDGIVYPQFVIFKM